MKKITTNRLVLRPLNLKDTTFILELFNTPDFLKYIGDKNIRNLQDAKTYLLEGPIKMYKDHGIGLYLVELKKTSISLGICGLIKRPSLEDVDLGFGFLPKYYNKGYAYEASKAMLDQAKSKYSRLVAITNSNNISSIKLLEKLAMSYEKDIEKLTNDVDLRLYGINFDDN
jgi:RimJ/RimL family protein N-acetyltransferase